MIQQLRKDFLADRSFGLFAVVVALIAIFSILEPGTFPTGPNFESMAFQMSEIGLLALAIAVTMIGGGIDLSVVATGNLAGIVAGSIVTAHAADGTPPGVLVLSIVAAIATGLVVGLINGVLVAHINIHPILATLASSTIVLGFATAVTNASTVFGQGAYSWLGSETIWVVPVPLVVVFLAGLVLTFVLRSSRLGFRLYLSGSNPIAASFSAIPVRRTILASYLLSGALAAMSGLIVLGRTDAANVDFGGSFVLLAILVAVLGGINPYGGEGRLLVVLLGLVAVQLLSTGINTVFSEQSGSNFLKEASWGLLLLVTLVAPAIRSVVSRRSRTSTPSANVSTTETPSTTETLEPSEGIALRVSNVSKSFGAVAALTDASLTVRTGTIHALMGENGSGKSTLTKVASGVHTADTGTVEVAGKVLNRVTPKASSTAGLEVIYQDLALFPHLTVAENIYLAADRALPSKKMKWGEANRLARESIDTLDVEIPLEELVADLPVAQKQLVAIARALSTNAKVIIMDEPTAALTPAEITQLIGVVRNLATNDGISFVFISHKLEEVTSLADDVTIIRDGKVVAAGPCADYDIAELARQMSGRDISAAARTRTTTADGSKPVVEFHNASVKGGFEGVSLELRAGEVLGVGGPLGSGRRSLALSLFGLLPLEQGSILIDGQEFKPRNSVEAQRAGIALVPEDRRTEGLFMSRSIGDNLSAASIGHHDGRLLDHSATAERSKESIKSLEIKTSNHQNLITTLSGGNQQRVVLGKWLQTKPRILILDRPTVGVDVGSKEGIYKLVAQLAAEGVAILLVTDELDELENLCDRAVVMNSGRIIEQVSFEDFETTDLRSLVAGKTA